MWSENWPNVYKLWGGEPRGGRATHSGVNMTYTYWMFPLSGSNFTLSVPFSFDFIWIFKVYYQVFELQTLTLLKSSFISLILAESIQIFCVLSEHTEVVNDVMYTIQQLEFSHLNIDWTFKAHSIWRILKLIMKKQKET